MKPLSIQQLNEDDLKELGLKLGHHKLVLQWIETKKDLCFVSPATSTASEQSI
jgi:hypothetical protein